MVMAKVGEGALGILNRLLRSGGGEKEVVHQSVTEAGKSSTDLDCLEGGTNGEIERDGVGVAAASARPRAAHTQTPRTLSTHLDTRPSQNRTPDKPAPT